MIGCTDDLVDKGSNSGSSGKMVEGTISFDFEIPDEEVRTRAEDFGSNTVTSLWIGVYDIVTGNRVGAKEFNVSSSSGSVELPVIYYDEHPEVAIVGVANYDLEYGDGEAVFKDGHGTPIKDCLAAAETWNDFMSISLICPPNGDLSPTPAILYNNQIMMGFVSASGNERPFSSITNNGSINITNADCIVKLTDPDSKYGPMHNTIDKKLYLYRLYSQINVTINAGPNAEVSNVSYRRCNLPKGVFLAERPVYTGNPNIWSSWSTTQSPNFADTQMEAKAGAIVNADSYYSDPDAGWINAGKNNNFTFYQYDNKHWGFGGNAGDGHAQREKLMEMNGEKFPASLSHQYNSYASYFVIKMTILDKSSEWNGHGGKSAEVEYVVHQGNCNDQWGNEALNPGKDFCVFRNMIYNYHIEVNGLNAITTTVTSKSHVDDGLSGVIWKAEIGALRRDVYGDTHPWGIFTVPQGHNRIVYRFCQGNGVDEEPVDYIISDYSKEELMKLKGIYWPTIDEKTVFQTPDECIRDQKLQLFWFFYVEDTTITSEDNSIGYPPSFFSYVKNNPGKYRMHMAPYKLDAQRDPDAYKVGFYIYDPDETDTTYGSGTDSDDCTYYTTNVCHVYEWKPDQLNIKLNPINNLQSFNVQKFLTQSVTIDLNSNNPNSEYTYGIDYQYVLRLYHNNNKVGDDIVFGSDLTYTLNLSNLDYDSYTYGIYAKALDTVIFTDSNETNSGNRGNITQYLPSWDFDDYYNASIDLKNGYNFDNLFLVDGASGCNFATARTFGDSENGEYGVAMGGKGSTSQRYFQFKVYSSCRISISYWVNSSDTRYVSVKVGDNDPVKDTVGSNNTKVNNKIYKTTFTTPIDVNGETTVKIYSQEGDVYFYEISLSD